MDSVSYETPERTYEDNPFWGEYGTNHCVPNMHLWVRDMRTPFWITQMRNESNKF